MRLCALLLATIAACSAALIAVPTAWALGVDSDPLVDYEHLLQQRDEVRAELAESDATVVTAADGGFAIVNDPPVSGVPAGAVAKGAARIPQITSSSFDASTGVMRFVWDGIGEVLVTPLERDAPRSVYADGTVVSATRVALNVSEVTLASHEFLEQHLVVDEQHAANKLIEWRYRFALPAGATAQATATGVVVLHQGLPLLTIHATVAVDEAGQQFPVVTSWDEAASELRVSYDGRSASPTGGVAIDPVFLHSKLDQQFVMNVCQVASGDAACEVQPGTGLPPQFRRLAGSSGDFKVAADATLGVYVQGIVGMTIAAGEWAALAYKALPDTRITGLAVHGTIESPSDAFQCRAELLNGDDDGPYALQDESSWAKHGDIPDSPGRFLKGTFDYDEKTGFSSFHDAGASFAALRIQNRSSSSQNVVAGKPVRCSIRTALAADGATQGDLFSVYMKDVHAPHITRLLDAPTTDGQKIRLVPGVTRTGLGTYSLAPTTKLAEQDWYQDGSSVKHAVHAGDKGSGVETVHITPPNVEPSADAMPAGSLGIAACATNTGVDDAPCPTASNTYLKPAVLSAASTQEGLNAVWYRATDFVGNRTTATPVFFLVDTMAPDAPAASFGSSTFDSVGALPVFDVRHSALLRWTESSDPGEHAAVPTGSGIAEYETTVLRLSATGAWEPASAHHVLKTPPVVPGQVAPRSIDIAGREGVYRVELRATDRAGNESAPTVRHFRLDDTEPLIRLEKPTGDEDAADVRSDNQLPPVRAQVLDPVIGGGNDAAEADVKLRLAGNADVVDRVALQRRAAGTDGGWVEVPGSVEAERRWTSLAADGSTVHAPYAPSTLGPDTADGLWDVRVSARDGSKADGSYLHEADTGPFKVCVDRAITAVHGDERPVSVEVVPIRAADSGIAGARIRFTVREGVQLARKWIVEAEVAGVWRYVEVRAHVPGQTAYEVDDWFQYQGVTAWRVSAATQKCTRRGDAAIARVAALADVDPLVLSEPGRMMPLLGLERRWSYWSLPTGGGTEAHVNVATGNLVVSRTLLSEPGVGLWTNVQLTYNSQQIGDDESLAENGVAGSHVTLAVGPGGSAATGDVAASGVRINDDGVVMRDVDGTIRTFVPTAPPDSAQWDGSYRATDASRLALRNSAVSRAYRLRQGLALDDLNDGVAHTVFKLTRPDGVTYYYARERAAQGIAHSALGRLLAVRDREGHQLTYAYECVAVYPKVGTRIDAARVHRAADGSWHQVPDDAGEQIVAACPGSVFEVAGAGADADLRMRLVAVRDERYSAGNGRRVRLSYHPRGSEFAGHVSVIRGHETGGRARQATLSYERSTTARTVRLRAFTITPRSGGSRTVNLSYDAAMDDPGQWFDKGVVVGRISDHREQSTRVSYGVPDGGLGFRFASPRVTLVENRADVLREDRNGVSFQYDVTSANTLSGVTHVRDQLDRRTEYRWHSAGWQTPAYGRVDAMIAPGGLVTQLEWNAASELVASRQVKFRVVREPVRVGRTAPSRILSGPHVGGVTFEAPYTAGSLRNADGDYTIDDSGVVRVAAGASALVPAEAHTVYVSYRPDGRRTVTQDIVRDAGSGQPTQIDDDQRWLQALGGRVRSEYRSDVPLSSDRPRTAMTWTPSAGPSVTRTLVRDLTAVVSPRGALGDAAAHRTTIDVDPATGRVLGTTRPSGAGPSTQKLSYYAGSGLLRSTTDAHGWTVAYAGYTDDGEPTIVSRRFCTAVPVPVGSACQSPLAGWSSLTTEAQVAANVPVAFQVSYTPEAQVSCIRDVRGDAAEDASRFVAFSYDGFGNVKRETTPWRRTAGSGHRLRRATEHDYDANGNRLKTTRDRTYELGSTSTAADCVSVPDPGAGTTVSNKEPQLHDVVYDVLDRPVLTRSPSNSIDGAKRVSRTEYDLAGDVVWQSEPLHEASSAGLDYTTTTRYDLQGRPIDVMDGEGRHTCTYYDAWDNPVAITPSRWQGRSSCDQAPDLSRSVLHSHDNAGQVVSTRQVSGKITFTLRDAEANAVRSEETAAERSGRAARLEQGVRVTRREFDAAGNLVEQSLPTRAACVKAKLSACVSSGRLQVAPRTTWSYDLLDRMTSMRAPRQHAESSLHDSRSVTYGYDTDGRRVRETLARDDGSVRVARTVYDPFGNVVQSVLPNARAASVQGRFSTFFTYGDDDALLTKSDRAHDVFSTWNYDRRGHVVSRVERSATSVRNEWVSRQRFSYHDDGSLRRGPFTVQPFEEGRVYADGTCLRAPGSDSSSPTFVYKVSTDQQFAASGNEPRWGDESWDVGERRRSGRIRLTKARYDGGALRTYDENGQPLAVSGCGTSITWDRRDGVGAPLSVTGQTRRAVTYRYGEGGELLAERYPDGKVRSSRYVVPDADALSLDPGAGLEQVAGLDVPRLKKRYLQHAYVYTLDGQVDVETRSETGRFTDSGSATDGPDANGFTTYEYDAAGALERSRSFTLGDGRRPVASEVSDEALVRDVAGNPRRIVTSVRRARMRAGKALKTQGRNYTYDVLGRISADDVSALPGRTYRYDDLGRLDAISVAGTVIENYAYSDALTRGAMLTRSITLGATPATRSIKVLEYGNGRTVGTASSYAGPRGQLVRSTQHQGATSATPVQQVIQYGYTIRNEQAFAIDQTYAKSRASRGRIARAPQRAQLNTSRMHYDLLGRRMATSDSADDLRDRRTVKRSATLALLAGSAQDPYAESTNDPRQPGARWLVRSSGRIIGELRDTNARYLVANHQSSTLMTLSAAPGAGVTATFDHDTWGKPLDGDTSLASGSDAERTHTVYTYTGMRQATAGDTTHHHARDYNAALRSWLQTDQYMDPWADLGLSLDPTTRDRRIYAVANPIGNVDTNGHRVVTGDCNSGCRISDPRMERLYGSGPGSGTVVIPDRCNCDWAYSPETSPGDPDHNRTGRPPVQAIAGPGASTFSEIRSTATREAIGVSSWITSAIPGGYTAGKGRKVAMQQWENCDWGSTHTGGRAQCFYATDQFLDLAPVGGAAVGVSRRVAGKALTSGIRHNSGAADGAAMLRNTSGFRGTNMSTASSIRYHYGAHHEGRSLFQYLNDATAFGRSPAGATADRVAMRDLTLGTRYRTPGGAGGVADDHGNIITYWYTSK